MGKKKIKSNKVLDSTFLAFYKRNYKRLIIVPALIFIVSLFFIFQAVINDGTPVYRDVSLKGGLSSIVEVDSLFSDAELLDSLERNFNDNSFGVSELVDEGSRVGFIIDTDLEEDLLISFLEEYFGENLELGENYNSNFISSTLSGTFFKQAVYILFVAFVLMSIVIFLYFKEFVPSAAVVLSGVFDVVVTIGVLDAFGIKISIAGIGALLMLIGYSIDTDVLLTNRVVVERGENYFEKLKFAFKTGVLMTATTLIAGIGALIFTNSPIIFEIALILVIGLLVDFISTWFQNAGIILWWIEKNKNN
ncbi:MAG: hypothetical protein PF569_06090 [Candidatus Woesearchaeota archaeon]|jgi:preprotein translocase subunit SecF|nr:hypothetical protein [Candidatus Woesearchaeota archaeon]